MVNCYLTENIKTKSKLLKISVAKTKDKSQLSLM